MGDLQMDRSGGSAVTPLSMTDVNSAREFWFRQRDTVVALPTVTVLYGVETKRRFGVQAILVAGMCQSSECAGALWCRRPGCPFWQLSSWNGLSLKMIGRWSSSGWLVWLGYQLRTENLFASHGVARP